MLKKINPFTIGLLLMFASCAKEGPTGPTGPAGPSIIGTISGFVKLYDMYGSLVTGNLDSAKLILSNNSAPSTPPEINGYYSFNTYGGLPLVTGNYYISATESGYGATIKNNIQLVSGNLNVDIKMSAIPDSFIYTFKAYSDTLTATDSLVLTFKPDTRLRNCILFADTIPMVYGQPGYYLYSKILSIPASTLQITYNVYAQELHDVGMTKGQKVYFAACSYVVGDASVYEDINNASGSTGQNVFNAVSGRTVDSTLVP